MNDDKAVRVRFAPSPTGYLHVGGARTALFNWLFARHHGGAFILRIEDTDRNRSSQEMTAAILDGMSWLGLDWDEGPVHQADGMVRHQADVVRLLGSGAAYRCFCSPAELEARRAARPAPAMATSDDGTDLTRSEGGTDVSTSSGAFRYDGRCRDVTESESAARAAAGAPYAIRFRVSPGTTAWDDAVYGRISFDNADIEDFVVLRSDGTPVYNMAVVSDDIAMQISHVLRGDDHISNTPKQILLYRALAAHVPVFAHLPMILGPDGRRLSKRHGATAVGEYRTQGILSDALVNFLALLGWSPGEDREILARAELIELFSLEGINRKSAVFDTQKLEWMNSRYLAELPASELIAVVRAGLDQAAGAPDDWLERLVELLRPRSRTLADLIEQARPYLTADVVHDPDAVSRHWKNPAGVAARLTALGRRLEAVEPWVETELEIEVRAAAEAEGIGAGKVIHPLRVALTGNAASAGIFEVAALLGRERTLRRIERAVAVLTAMAEESGIA
jgi:glutamyl-tRNA synthetase